MYIDELDFKHVERTHGFCEENHYTKLNKSKKLEEKEEVNNKKTVPPVNTAGTTV
jgi:hypothetical protein